MIKHRFYVSIMAALVIASLSACGAKEREEWQQKVAELERQLIKANSELAEMDAVAVELRSMAEGAQGKLKEAQVTIDAQASKLARVQVERDKLKQEIAQLKKKKRRG